MFSGYKTYIVAAVAVITAIAAWATGASVYVNTVDKKYLESLKRIQAQVKKWFPYFPLIDDAEIQAKDIVKSPLKKDYRNYILLFSGGIDSLFTYVRHKEKRPILVSFWGADVPLEEYKFWRRFSSKLKNFADYEKAEIRFVRTNARLVLNRETFKLKHKIDPWGKIMHGLMLTSLCVPLTSIKKASKLIIASPGKGVKDGTNILIGSRLMWRNTKVIVDGYSIDRQEKVRYFSGSNQENLKYLRVCYSRFYEDNCGYCEKCLRTIIGLIAEGIDPTRANFNIKNNILYLARKVIERGRIHFSGASLDVWKGLQKNISGYINEDKNKIKIYKKYHWKNFIEWFRKFDFSKYDYRPDDDPNSKIFIIIFWARYKGLIYTIKRVFNVLRDKLKN